jgi:GTPase SAR1 family protein
MRIAISGSSNQGKTTLINDFLQEWPNYQVEKQSYRNILSKDNLPHSQDATQKSQWAILNCMIDEMQTYKPGDKIIMDRCPIDNLIYSLWCFEKGVGDIDKEFIDKCIPLVCESMRHLDIIFFIPITKAAPVSIVDDVQRNVDPIYIKEIDNIFKMIGAQYRENNGRNPFFPKDDAPGWIEIFGDRHTRIAMIKQYIDVDGDLIGADENISSLINPYDNNAADNETRLMQALVEDQIKVDKLEKDLTYEREQIKLTLGS